jgi:polysaccharide export outer membrane protein
VRRASLQGSGQKNLRRSGHSSAPRRNVACCVSSHGGCLPQPDPGIAPAAGPVQVCLVLAAAAITGCARRAAPPTTVVIPAKPAGPYRIQPGDTIDVRFEYHPNDNQKLRVRPDGKLGLGLTGDVQAARLTADELASVIRMESSKYLRDPKVSVVVTETVARAYIGGEVSEAGFVALNKPLTVFQAVLERGGFTPSSDMKNITVISRGEGDERIMRRVNVQATPDEQPAEALVLAPDDVVVVPKTGIASANTFVEQWIDGLTPQILKGVRFPTTDNNN